MKEDIRRKGILNEKASDKNEKRRNFLFHFPPLSHKNQTPLYTDHCISLFCKL